MYLRILQNVVNIPAPPNAMVGRQAQLPIPTVKSKEVMYSTCSPRKAVVSWTTVVLCYMD